MPRIYTRPVYSTGYILTDELTIEPEVRCYVTGPGFIKDPFGHTERYNVSGNGQTWHLKEEFLYS